MKKHVIKTMKLNEISSVDRPAQIGATSVLMKRRGDPQTELIKATFQEALTGELLEDRVRTAFYNAFDDMYDGQCAFKQALTDELIDGGDGSTASTAYKTWLGGLVDQAVTAAKGAGAANLDPEALDKIFKQAATDWLNSQEQTMTIKTLADLKKAIENAQAAGDKVTVADVSAIHKAATELKAEGELPATGVLAKTSTAPALDDATTAAVNRMVKRDALSTDLRKHYDGLADDAARDAFLAKSATEQETELTKAAGDDPVVYTTLDGTDIRKSAGDTLLSLAKRNDTMARELAKSTATTEDVTLTKRAGDELGNVGGELVGKKALLKAVDGITDTATKDAALAVLKSANELGKGAFVKRGSTAGNDGVVDQGNGPEMSEAEVKLEEMAKAHATEHKVTFEKAYSEVIQTADGAKLYAESLAG
jgi:hypothetical protein